jgi:hypothetical protein
MFTTSCPPTNPKLPIHPFPTFNISGDPIPGRNITISHPIPDKATDLMFHSGLSIPSVATIDENGNVTLPQNLSGQVYAFAIASDNTTVAGPAVLLVETNPNGTLIN